jgi:hypothetical protein
MGIQIINIGVEGNDGTGDSIRESFRKTNENFNELFGLLGDEGNIIEWTKLGGTPDEYESNKVLFSGDVDSSGNTAPTLSWAGFVSDNYVNANDNDSILVSYAPGAIILRATFNELSQDTSPTLSAGLNAAGSGIAGAAINAETVGQFNAVHGTSYTEDDFLMTRKYADGRYVSALVPQEGTEQPTGVLHYTLEIEKYIDGGAQILYHYNAAQEKQENAGHGIDSAYNGSAFVYYAEDTKNPNLTVGQTYYIRRFSDSILWFYDNKDNAQTVDEDTAANTRIDLTPVAEILIAETDIHTITDANYDPNLTGTYLGNELVPRKNLILREGDTLIGPLNLHDHPGDLAGVEGKAVDDYQAVTKFYVDNTANHTSPENIYVSTGGDDLMTNVPAGLEGTCEKYAYASINAAARRAEELMLAAPVAPGPYMQTLTHSNYTEAATVLKAEIDLPSDNTARRLIDENILFLQKESLAFLKTTYPNFTFEDDDIELYVKEILSAISMDINRGSQSNFLTKRAANNFYSSVSRRILIRKHQTEFISLINFLNRYLLGSVGLTTGGILNNLRYQTINISTIQTKLVDENNVEVAVSPAILTTDSLHGWPTGAVILIENAVGLESQNISQVNDKIFYIKRITEDNEISFELYLDPELNTPFNGLTYTDYAGGGTVSRLWQTEETQTLGIFEYQIADISSTFPALITTDIDHNLNNFSNANSATIRITGVQETSDNGPILADLFNEKDFTILTTEDPKQFYLFDDSGFKLSRISSISFPNQAAIEITTENPHTFIDGEGIVITDVNAPSNLNQVQYYVQTNGTDSYIKLVDSNGNDIDPGDDWSEYTGGGIITSSANAIDSSDFIHVANTGIFTKETAGANNSSLVGVNGRFETFRNIINQGLSASADTVYGSTYKLVIDNGPGYFTDQTQDSNADALPGKVLRGKTSNALGKIVNFYNNLQSEATVAESNPTVFQVLLLTPTDYTIGEELEFGNYINDKEITIKIETGIYEEDYPIRVMNNVSIVGDEFRRVIVKPKTQGTSNIARISQSKWATNYFYRDSEFDGLQVARGGTDFINQVGDVQGKFGYHYLQDPSKPLNVGESAVTTNYGDYQTSADIIAANKDYIIEETNFYLKSVTPEVPYNIEKSRRDTGYVIDALIADLRIGGNSNILEMQGSFYGGQFTGAEQESACSAALSNIKTLATSLVQNIEPTYVIQQETFTAQAGTEYFPGTGDLRIIIGTGHGLNEGDYIEILPDSLVFTCAADNHSTLHYYPDTASPAYKTKIQIQSLYQDTGIVVNVGTHSSITDPTVPHIFREAESQDNSITIKRYEAGSTIVTDIEAVDLRITNDPDEINSFPINELETRSSVMSVIDVLIDQLVFVFDPDYNPPLRTDQMDVFLLGDTTIIRQLTCRGHGGFMAVLDPDNQILTKSPYIQTASSFSKSINKQTFSGGMFVDAYVGNLPTKITSVAAESSKNIVLDDGSSTQGYFALNIQSDVGEGLRIREPQLPCPFYLDGRRFQINAISDYNSFAGTAKIYLDASSNNKQGFIPGQIPNLVYPMAIFLQTAGNRSILGNDYTQVNDLGYGLLCTNGAFSEMVSMFTYYCHVAYYAANGAEIRSLNGSNGYGNFGLVAEGADPNEIPDQVVLSYDMVQPLKAFTTPSQPNEYEQTSITVYDARRMPAAGSEFTINHGTVTIDGNQVDVGRLNYVVSSITSLSDRDASSTRLIRMATTETFAEDTKLQFSGEITGTVAANHYNDNWLSLKSLTGEISTTTTIVGILDSDNVQIFTYDPAIVITEVDKDGIVGLITQDDIVNAGVTALDTSNQINPTVTQGFTGLQNVFTKTTGDGYGLCVDIGADLSVSIVTTGQNYAVGDSITITFNDGVSDRDITGITISTVHGSSKGVYSNLVYRLDIIADNTTPIDKFAVLQGEVPHDTYLEYRDYTIFQFSNVNDRAGLVTRPSTAINLDESDDVTYRSLAFQSVDSISRDILINDGTQATVEVGYDYIAIETLTMNSTNPSNDFVGNNCGNTIGDTRIAIKPLDDAQSIYGQIARITKDTTNYAAYGIITDITDANYVGGMIFTNQGKTHRIINYKELTKITFSDPISVNKDDLLTQGTASAVIAANYIGSNIVFVYDIDGGDLVSGTSNLGTISNVSSGRNAAFIDIAPQDSIATGIGWTATDLTTSGTYGISAPMVSDESTIFYVGLPELSSAEITVRISLCRATGHDFTQIGTGGFNTSNYPNVILGPPTEGLADSYTSAPNAFKAQVWERRKGRVFWVSTDQYGFFRVGKFFEVDQGTGDITFSGQVGLSSANSLGFKKGVVIDEFSADDTFADLSGKAVPVEKAIAGYINRVLGYNPQALSQITGAQRIGTGFLTLNGVTPMEGNLDANQFRLVNVGPPTEPDDAITKAYVDSNVETFNALGVLRDFYQTPLEGTAGELLVATGRFIIYTEIESGGSAFSVGQVIKGNQSGANGVVVHVESITDILLSNTGSDTRKIIYDLTTPANFNAATDTISNFAQDGQTALGSSAVMLTNNINEDLGGPYQEYTHASVISDSDIKWLVSKPADGQDANISNTKINLTIQSEVIFNSMINPAAGILQSKLDMQSSKVYADDFASITQADLGLSAFNSKEFSTLGTIRLTNPITATAGTVITQGASGATAAAIIARDITNSDLVTIRLSSGNFVAGTSTNEFPDNVVKARILDAPASASPVENTGWIELKTATSDTDGVTLPKLSWMQQFEVIGRKSAVTNNGHSTAEHVTFKEVINLGGGVHDDDFGLTFTAGENDVLLRSAYGTYGTKKLAYLPTADTFAVRNPTPGSNDDPRAGSIHASSIIIGSSTNAEVLALNSADSNKIELKSPTGNRTILKAGSDSANNRFTIEMPDQLNVGDAKFTYGNARYLFEERSMIQYSAKNNEADALEDYSEGFVASNWLYTKGIEALDEANTRNAGNDTTVGNTGGTGIVFGAHTGFSESAADNVVLFTGGTARAMLNSQALHVDQIKSLTSNGDFVIGWPNGYPDANGATGSGKVKIYPATDFTKSVTIGTTTTYANLTVNGNLTSTGKSTFSKTFDGSLTEEFSVAGRSKFANTVTITANTYIGNDTASQELHVYDKIQISKIDNANNAKLYTGDNLLEIKATDITSGENTDYGKIHLYNDVTVKHDLVVDGNLTVSGTTTTLNVTEITGQDPLISLGQQTTEVTGTTIHGVEANYKYGTPTSSDYTAKFGIKPSNQRFTVHGTGFQGRYEIDNIYFGGSTLEVHSSLTASGNFAQPAFKFESDGDFVAEGDIIGFSGDASDIRLKTNVQTIDSALEKVNKIRGVTFERIDKNNRKSAGVIAQELQEVLPEAIIDKLMTVNGVEEEYKIVNYDAVHGLLIEAIKELYKMIKEK